MWRRIRRELLFEYYWWKRQSGKKWSMDSPLGIMGILLITSGIIILLIIGQAFASVFRNMVPIVGGTQVAGVYWSSVVLAIKFSFAFLVFIVVIILIVLTRVSRRRK